MRNVCSSVLSVADNRLSVFTLHCVCLHISGHMLLKHTSSHLSPTGKLV